MGTSCVPLIADLFLYYYEREFMLSLSDNNQSDVAGPRSAVGRAPDS